MKKVFVSHIKVWKPSSENLAEKPTLPFADSLFKRRLSQISRMTVQVIHDLLEEVPEAKEYKQIFISFRGELSREFSINKSILQDSEILPAAFSLSVFNTPIASASLALKLKSGYSVIYPSKQDFRSAVLAASSAVLSGAEQKIILVYADEFIPKEYESLVDECQNPFSFACLLEGEQNKSRNSVAVDFEKFSFPEEFINSMKAET